MGNYTPPTMKSRIAFALGYLSEQLYYVALRLGRVLYRSALKLDLRAASEGVARADGADAEVEEDEREDGTGCPYCDEEDEGDVQD